MQIDAAGRAVEGGAGLVHPEMPVESDAEQDQVESVADRGVVVQAVLDQVGSRWIQNVKRGRRQVHTVDQLTLQHLPGTARIVRRNPAEFIEREHARARERDEPGAHAS